MLFLTKILNKFSKKCNCKKEEPKSKEPKLYTTVIRKQCITVNGLILHDKRNTIVKHSPRESFRWLNIDSTFKRPYIIEIRLNQLIKKYS